MTVPFQETTRSLAQDGHIRSFWSLAALFLLLLLWFFWAFLGRVKLHLVSDHARLEMGQDAYPLRLAVAGRVKASHLEVGKSVEKGDLLLQLDAEEVERGIQEATRVLAQLEEAEVNRAGAFLEEQRALKLQHKRLESERAKIRVRLSEAKVLAEEGRGILTRFKNILEEGLLPEIDYIKAKMEVTRLDADVASLEREQERADTGLTEADARQEQAYRDGEVRRLALARQTEHAGADVDTRKHHLEDYQIRAESSGSIAETIALPPGIWLPQGTSYATLLPPGTVKVRAQFTPGQALGRIEQGQMAVLRFPAFPWLHYGSRGADVIAVSGEIRDGFLEITLRPEEMPESQIPLAHGMTCQVEIVIDEVSPWVLFLRKLGKKMDNRVADHG